MSPRRESASAFVAALGAAALLFWASSERWAAGRGRIAGTFLNAPPAHRSGRDVAPLVVAAAFVALAGAVAIPATRGVGRLIAGLVMTTAGVAAVVEAVLRRSTGVSDLRQHLPEAHATGWPWLAVVGGVVLTLAGLAVLIRGRRWPSMSRRYEKRQPAAPAPRRPLPAADASAPRDRPDATPGDRPDGEGPVDQVAVWDALDRGEDPTARRAP